MAKIIKEDVVHPEEKVFLKVLNFDQVKYLIIEDKNGIVLKDTKMKEVENEL